MKKFFMAIAVCLVAVFCFSSWVLAQDVVEIRKDLYDCAILGKLCPKSTSKQKVPKIASISLQWQKDVATKKDLEVFATKKELEPLATKKDIETLNDKLAKTLEELKKKPTRPLCGDLAEALGKASFEDIPSVEKAEAKNLMRMCLNQGLWAVSKDSLWPKVFGSGRGGSVKINGAEITVDPSTEKPFFRTPVGMCLLWGGAGAAGGAGLGGLLHPGESSQTHFSASGAGWGAAGGFGGGCLLGLAISVARGD